MVAGADLPEEREVLRSRIALLGWSERLAVDNDTLALLRSGTDRGWGVAVVCGAGINCIGVAPDGREARFASLGDITGDWGGGNDVGLAALMAAARSADGRGTRTILQASVPAHFGLEEPLDVARALHVGQMPNERLGELAPIVFSAARDGDDVAVGIVHRLTDEIVKYASAAMGRLALLDEGSDVVLGGGVIRAASPEVIKTIDLGVREVAPSATVRMASTGPIVGAALLGLDELGAGSAAAARVRAELHDAFLSVEGARPRASDGGATAVAAPAQPGAVSAES
jgi:N-acetylglucosamine kinase-like BadF-type ATPase